MNKFLFLAALLFTTVSLHAAEGVMPYNMFNENGVLHFNYKAEDLAPREKAARAQLEKDLQAIINIDKKDRTFENTYLAYDKAFDAYSDSLGQAGFLAYVSQDKALRNAALALEQEVSNYLIEVATRRDIYQAFKDYADTNPQLGPIEAKMLKDAMIGFKKSGLTLNDKDLETFKELNKQKAKNSIEFSKNIREYKDSLEVTKEQLDGMGEDYINKLKKRLTGNTSLLLIIQTMCHLC